MPIKLLSTIADERVTAFDGFANALKRDPTLKAIRVTFRDWSGSASDLDPPAAAELPIVEVWPQGGSTSWGFHQAHLTTVDIEVSFVLEGTDVREGLKFWRAIERAIFPIDGAAADAVHDKLTAAGISSVEIVQAAKFEADRAEATGRLYGAGTFRIGLYIPTATHS